MLPPFFLLLLLSFFLPFHFLSFTAFSSFPICYLHRYLFLLSFSLFDRHASIIFFSFSFFLNLFLIFLFFLGIFPSNLLFPFPLLIFTLLFLLAYPLTHTFHSPCTSRNFSWFLFKSSFVYDLCSSSFHFSSIFSSLQRHLPFLFFDVISAQMYSIKCLKLWRTFQG